MPTVNGRAPFKVVDLFCGAGGLACGFRDAGFSIVHAVDNWPPAYKTYRSNHGDHVSCDAINASLRLPQCDIIMGGPPCQGFSSAGNRKLNDERNSLVAEFAESVAANRPIAFVFENVEGFLTGAGGDYVLDLLDTVIEAGYCVHIRKINAANYGVPQHRKRVIAIGGLGWEPNFPAATHAAYGAPGAELANTFGLPPSPSVGETIGSLPSATARGGATDDDCHVYSPLKGDDLRRASLLTQGQCMHNLPEELWHPSYRRRANRRVMDGTPTERRGGAPAGLRRLWSNQPSKAITGGALRDFLHPTENRLLTVRECAVLQTFPVNYQFHGSQSERIQQIGNAVPPLMASAIANSLRSDLSAERSGERRKGALLSFVPTLSYGMSQGNRTSALGFWSEFCIDGVPVKG